MLCYFIFFATLTFFVPRFGAVAPLSLLLLLSACTTVLSHSGLFSLLRLGKAASISVLSLSGFPAYFVCSTWPDASNQSFYFMACQLLLVDMSEGLSSLQPSLWVASGHYVELG